MNPPGPERNNLIRLRPTEAHELPRIVEAEQGGARPFIIPYSLERHRAELAKPGVLYQSIYRAEDWIGFLILVLDPDRRSVEFRRIVITEPGRGHGRQAVALVSGLCAGLGRGRVWLDVFESNTRARRVYEQCGYVPFGKSDHEGRTLLLYEKLLAAMSTDETRIRN